ncbi:fibrinogen C domain-containing protein 1-A-like [Engraulis encrasicolus]|uniref:fibrinogen C domain-containing protein 1-A-like n=1 Tax=Engraulis encrasicolus TaxID=184585 RepID=UPI002FD59356
MVNDRWKIMNIIAELEDGPQHKTQRTSCSYLLCTILLFVAVLLAVTVTGSILLTNHYQAPRHGSELDSLAPHISTNQETKANALVTIDRGDGSRINVFIEPNFPDYNANFQRLEGVQTSLLHSFTDHDSDLKSVRGQERVLLVMLAEEVAKLSAHATQLKMEYEGLRRGQSNIGQELGTLQTDQQRLIVLLSESEANMVKVVNSVSDALDSMNKQTGSIKSRLKADLQRAPIRIPRPKGCGNGEGARPRDCSDIYASGQREDGLYSVFPVHFPAGFQVYCDMTTDGGGWTMIQRHEDGSVNFFRGWLAYREGFGKITGEHWLGMKRIHALTSQANYELRIDLEDFENSTSFAQYGSFGVGLFSVDPDEDGYPLTISDYSGTAGDSLPKHNGMKFTTKDVDNDDSENNCAAFYHGAWWYRNCHTSNLNGQYLRGQHTSYADGIEWSSWTGWQYSLKFVEMKIRPTREDNQ